MRSIVSNWRLNIVFGLPRDRGWEKRTCFFRTMRHNYCCIIIARNRLNTNHCEYSTLSREHDRVPDKSAYCARPADAGRRSAKKNLNFSLVINQRGVFILYFFFSCFLIPLNIVTVSCTVLFIVHEARWILMQHALGQRRVVQRDTTRARITAVLVVQGAHSSVAG